MIINNGILQADILKYDTFADIFRDYPDAELGFAPSLSAFYMSEKCEKEYFDNKEIETYFKINSPEIEPKYGGYFINNNGKLEFQKWH